MAFSEKQKRRIVALTRRLKEDKGLTVKQADIQKAINEYKEAQKEYSKIKEEHSDSEVISKRMDDSIVKVQKIVDDMNEYMRILHPEGLLDMGSGPSVVSHG